MNSVTDTDNWRKKYLDSLGSLENEQRQFRAMEAALKRITGRLCTASLGQSPKLDGQIRKIQNAIRGEVTAEELDKITSTLTEAIQALDQPVAPPASVAAAKISPAPSAQSINAQPDPPPQNTAIADERIRAFLAALLAELRRDAELISQADSIDSKLTAVMTADQLSDVLSSLSDMVGQRIKRIEHAKQEIEVLLSHIVGKLDEIGQFVADQNQNQNESQSHASSETLKLQLAGEMKAMGESVESAGDLQQIRRPFGTSIASNASTTLTGIARAIEYCAR